MDYQGLSQLAEAAEFDKELLLLLHQAPKPSPKWPLTQWPCPSLSDLSLDESAGSRPTGGACATTSKSCAPGVLSRPGSYPVRHDARTAVGAALFTRAVPATWTASRQTPTRPGLPTPDRADHAQ